MVKLFKMMLLETPKHCYGYLPLCQSLRKQNNNLNVVVAAEPLQNVWGLKYTCSQNVANKGGYVYEA